MAGKLELDVGGMFAEKSTNLIRKGKRKLRAGKKVVFLKPSIDNRYSFETVMTHDGTEHDAINIAVDLEDNCCDDFGYFTIYPSIRDADVVCIDEIQFFPEIAITYIDELLRLGKDVYCAGLDMDRWGKPFGIVPYLMARAEEVTKHHAVCHFCGNDAWVSLGTEKLKNNNQVSIGNDFVPACRTCADKFGGVR